MQTSPARCVPPVVRSVRAPAAGPPAPPGCRRRCWRHRFLRQLRQRGERAALGFLHHDALAVAEGLHLRRAARVGHGFAFGAAQQQGIGADQLKRGGHRCRVFRVGVAADDQAGAVHRVHQLDQAVRRVAQADHAAHVQQAFQAGAQDLGGDEGHVAGRDRVDAGLRRHAQRGQHFRGENPLRLGRRAVHQHRQAFARQQQRQQRREHRQLARAVVARQHHDRACAGGHFVQARVRGVQEAGHLRGRFALDAHGQAERADFQVGHRAVEHLAEQVGRLLARDGARAVLAAPDFLDVLADSHGEIVFEAGLKAGSMPNEVKAVLRVRRPLRRWRVAHQALELRDARAAVGAAVQAVLQRGQPGLVAAACSRPDSRRWRYRSR